MTESGNFRMDAHAISFGPFRLLAAQRLLLEGDKPVRLGSRAFDILAALVERAGEVVGKQELITRAWPKTLVEEANLKIQVSALRRALGDGQGGHRYVVTVPGRGYNFVAPVSLKESSRAPPPPRMAATAVHNLPFAATRMIGREESRAATPRTIAAFSSARKKKRRCGLRANGWPITPRKSTICARRSTGPFRQAAMDRWGWR
jgi:DNA-binding winged helix-turn-helix (wHTH) protein